MASQDSPDVVGAVGALANQLASARTDDQTPPFWKTTTTLKRRNKMHESGGVLQTRWCHIEGTQQRVRVLVSLGGHMGRSREIR